MGETHDPRALRNRLAMQGGRNIVLAPHAYGGEGSETSPRTAAGKLAVAAGNASTGTRAWRKVALLRARPPTYPAAAGAKFKTQ